MAISLGVVCAFLIKNDGAASGILNMLIPTVVFLGGGYVPLSTMGEGVSRLSVISPVKWTNEALFKIIYNNDYSAVLPAIMICLGVAALFIMISAYFSSKEAV
jgi:ABC-2 type transport system permease protein